MIFTECPNDFWHKRKIYNFDPYNLIHAFNYKPTRWTRFLIHGYIDKGDENWPVDSCKDLLMAGVGQGGQGEVFSNPLI
uniref:Lipase domain-containing protein n=1 Tax=Sinocyclocheilus grahami TaxID=75366 RepID=A0A672QUL1_SINGR